MGSVLGRRDLLRVVGLGGASMMLLPGPALAQGKQLFRMDEQNAVHFLAGHFVPQFLTKPIEYEVKQFASSGQARVSALARGAIDGITTSWTYLAQIAFNELPGTCIAGMAGGGSRLLAAKDSPIRSYEDLKGKKIGVVEFSFQDIMLIYALKKKGIDPFKDVQRVNVGNPAGVVAAMSTGRVDACAIWEPFASIMMIDSGAKMIANLHDESFGTSNGGLFVHNDFIKKYPELTQDIVDAIVKATNHVVTNRAAWVERTRTVTGQSEAVAAAAVANCSPSLDIPMQTIRQISTAMFELGIQNRDVKDEIVKNVDYRFLEKATGKTKEQLGYGA